jgi:hypothetical protein
MNQDPHHSADAQRPDCLLTLALPLALEEEMLDLLRQHPDLVPGFSVVQGHGIGADATLTTMMERVEGRARRVFVSAVMHGRDVAPLVAHLREAFSSPEVFYWVLPLQEFGRLA